LVTNKSIITEPEHWEVKCAPSFAELESCCVARIKSGHKCARGKAALPGKWKSNRAHLDQTAVLLPKTMERAGKLILRSGSPSVDVFLVWLEEVVVVLIFKK
jgi:hypothetical protein